ncbi:DEAD/DEAH box helicase, partial [bacterium]|nr:DEAD/DEAH box helicase [bacterium]
MYNPQNPLIVQSDRSIFLETDNQHYEEARDQLARFAELEKSPEHLHTYRINPLSLWNAAAAGMNAGEIINVLDRFSKYEIPNNIVEIIREQVARYGRLKLVKAGKGLLALESADESLLAEIVQHKTVKPYIDNQISPFRIEVNAGNRGYLKQALIKIGFPVEDLAGYRDGAPLELSLLPISRSGKEFQMRRYQEDAVARYWASGDVRGGSGVLVLPCGSGKTVIGMGIMEKVKMHTLILTTNVTALHQWREELLDKTDINPRDIAEYSGEHKSIGPITIATYQILTYRHSKNSPFVHFGIFDEHNWGLIIYDEVHLLPAPVFRAVAVLQSRRRLGLTATLVREDGKEDDVFSLIGPKKVDIPWRELETQGWIAEAVCVEYRLALSPEKRMDYALSEKRKKYTIASTNPRKMDVIKMLLERHAEDQVLIIGQYIDQLKKIAAELEADLITGSVKNDVRDVLYEEFRSGRIKRLVVSKVANFAVDIPSANVAIQVS